MTKHGFGAFLLQPPWLPSTISTCRGDEGTPESLAGQPMWLICKLRRPQEARQTVPSGPVMHTS